MKLTPVFFLIAFGLVFFFESLLFFRTHLTSQNTVDSPNSNQFKEVVANQFHQFGNRFRQLQQDLKGQEIKSSLESTYFSPFRDKRRLWIDVLITWKEIPNHLYAQSWRWWKDVERIGEVVYIVGSNNTKLSQQEEMELREQMVKVSLHAHILVVNADDYEYPPIRKTLEGFRYFGQLPNTTYEWILNSDSDTYINLGRVEMLTLFHNHSIPQYLGDHHHKPWFNTSTFIDYCQGQGYLMTHVGLQLLAPQWETCLQKYVVFGKNSSDNFVGFCYNLNGILCRHAINKNTTEKFRRRKDTEFCQAPGHNGGVLERQNLGMVHEYGSGSYAECTTFHPVKKLEHSRYVNYGVTKMLESYPGPELECRAAIGVLSSSSLHSFQLRNSVRNTWKSFAMVSGYVEIYFLIDANQTNSQFDQEQSLYKDLVFTPHSTFRDNILSWFSWGLNQTRCEFFIVVPELYYLRPLPLLNQLTYAYQTNTSSLVVLGNTTVYDNEENLQSFVWGFNRAIANRVLDVALSSSNTIPTLYSTVMKTWNFSVHNNSINDRVCNKPTVGVRVRTNQWLDLYLADKGGRFCPEIIIFASPFLYVTPERLIGGKAITTQSKKSLVQAVYDRSISEWKQISKTKSPKVVSSWQHSFLERTLFEAIVTYNSKSPEYGFTRISTTHSNQSIEVEVLSKIPWTPLAIIIPFQSSQQQKLIQFLRTHEPIFNATPSPIRFFATCWNCTFLTTSEKEEIIQELVKINGTLFLSSQNVSDLTSMNVTSAPIQGATTVAPMRNGSTFANSTNFANPATFTNSIANSTNITIPNFFGLMMTEFHPNLNSSETVVVLDINYLVKENFFLHCRAFTSNGYHGFWPVVFSRTNQTAVDDLFNNQIPLARLHQVLGHWDEGFFPSIVALKYSDFDLTGTWNFRKLYDSYQTDLPKAFRGIEPNLFPLS